LPSKHILVQGKVQGVFYRATAKEVADKLNIKGWIRNTQEGSVEIVASGDEPSLQSFIDWCQKGPEYAYVHSLVVSDAPEESFSAFTIKR
jgi:acylphosphatase